MCGRKWLALMAVLVSPVAGGAQTDPLSPQSVQLIPRSELGRIGGMDERQEYALTGVSGGAVLSSGVVAVADRLSREIRLYTPEGQFLRKTGREGDGPGEFRAIRGVVALNEGRLLVWDIQRRRISVFASDGELLDTWLPDLKSAALLIPEFVGATPEGQVVLRSTSTAMFLRNEQPGARRDSVALAVFGPGGAVVGSRITVEGPERVFYRDGKNWGTDRLLLGRELAMAVVQEGLVVGVTDSLSLRIRRASGAWAPYLRVERPSRRASRQLVEAERNALLEEIEQRAVGPIGGIANGRDIRREFAELEARRMKEMDAYSTVPAFNDLVASSDGGLWVSDYPDFITGTTSWIAWDRNRRLLGRVLLPEHERLVAAGSGLLVTVVKDELGVETVVIYELSGT